MTKEEVLEKLEQLLIDMAIEGMTPAQKAACIYGEIIAPKLDEIRNEYINLEYARIKTTIQ